MYFLYLMSGVMLAFVVGACTFYQVSKHKKAAKRAEELAKQVAVTRDFIKNQQLEEQYWNDRAAAYNHHTAPSMSGPSTKTRTRSQTKVQPRNTPPNNHKPEDNQAGNDSWNIPPTFGASYSSPLTESYSSGGGGNFGGGGATGSWGDAATKVSESCSRNDYSSPTSSTIDNCHSSSSNSND